MFIGISVGHQKALCVIPVSCVNIEELRDLVPDLIQRLNHMVKGRTPNFDYTIMGSKIDVMLLAQRHEEFTASVVLARVIHAAVRYAQFTNHDHVSFCLIENLWETLDRYQSDMDGKASADRRQDPHLIPLQGIDALYIHELARLDRLKERMSVGISIPYIQW